MPYHPNPPLRPRNGHTLVVGIGARISGCANQKELSLEDQVDHAKEVVAGMYDGPVEYRVIATKGKGERLDRPELAEVEAMLRTRELDLLVVEDIGRLVRGAEAIRLCGIAVDHGTRVLAPNDGFDTAAATWEDDLFDACRQHVGHNTHTSRRLKHKLMNRFLTLGGSPALPIFGYVKPPGARTYDDWKRDEAAMPVYREWFRLLRQTRNCSGVAAWLNREGVPTGPYARRKTWDAKMVRRITRNALLKGMPARGHRHTVKHHETGKRVSVKNPGGPRFRECPHLAHVPPDEFDEVNALLDAENQGFGRKPVHGADPRWRVPRACTRFPGQHARCWYCGRHFVWGGNGVTENLMCSGSREWLCWNSVGFNGALAARRLVEAITAELYRLDGIDEQFRELVRRAGKEGGADLARRWDKLKRREESLAREKENLLAAIAAYGPKPMFQEKVSDVEAAERELARERQGLERLRDRVPELPQSVGQIREMLGEQFRKLATGSPDFGELMRQLVPEFHVYLVRLLDGGHPLPRAKVRLALEGIAPDAKYVSGLGPLLARELTLDLFERPPQRERIRAESVRLAAQGMQQREIGRRLPEKATQAAVQRALALDREVRELGLETPYVLLEEAPQDYPKLRRHRNPNYRFTPLDGYQPRSI